MKKKIFNGILLVAALFATSSAFVSCKDNDADEIANAKIAIQKDLNTQIADLKAQIEALRASIPDPCTCPDWTNKINELKDKIAALEALSATLATKDDVNQKIATLEEAIKAIKPGMTKEEVEALIASMKAGLTEDIQKAVNDLQNTIQEQINTLSEKIAAIYTTQVTSLNIDAVKNPVFGFVSAPVDLQSNMLIACFGKAASNIEFPVGEGKYIAKVEDILTLDNNAGKLFVTVNPSSVDFSGKTLTLESTAGNPAPIVLSPLAASTEELNFGWTRAENAFYETTATIPAEMLKDAKVSITKQDLRNLKDDIKFIIKNRNQTKNGVTQMAKDLYEIYARNILTAYRLKATWGDNYNTFSETKIAAMSVQPLSYSFDPEGAITVKELEEIEDQITGHFTSNGGQVTGTATDENGNTATVTIDSNEPIKQAINKFWDVFNSLVQKALNNVNYALQPTLLVREGNKFSRANNHTYSGEITLIPTSRTAEIFAPAYKKFVKVTCDGAVVEGDLLNKVIDGTVLEIPLKLESGKKYEVEYQAVDYTGVTRVKNYTIYGK